jgi:hypothetical protein
VGPAQAVLCLGYVEQPLCHGWWLIGQVVLLDELHLKAGSGFGTRFSAVPSSCKNGVQTHNESQQGKPHPAPAAASFSVTFVSASGSPASSYPEEKKHCPAAAAAGFCGTSASASRSSHLPAAAQKGQKEKGNPVLLLLVLQVFA